MKVIMTAIFVSMTAAGIALGAAVAGADELSFIGNNVVVDDAVISAGKKGERTSVRFRVINDSNSIVHLMGVETDVTEGSKLVARIGDNETTTLQSIGVGADDVLDFATSHLWYEVGPLTRDLSEGETLTMQLHLVGANLSVPLHVHERPLAER